MKLLHIMATPREQVSNTLRVTNVFLDSMQARYPALKVDVVDIFNRDLPAVDADNIETKYTLMLGQPIDKHQQESWHQIEMLIQSFLSADVYVISSPMWNFGIPYALKYYIDAIIQPGYVYKYNESGQPVPLVLGKKMVCITSRGGDYSKNSPMHVFDFQEPYLRAIFGFIGITDMHFINAQPMDITRPLREAAIEQASREARSLAAEHPWTGSASTAPLTNPPELKPRPI